MAVNGMLVGASLDQAIKQLPARHRIGVRAYSGYSQAADLDNGVAWYGGLGLVAAALALAVAAPALGFGRERSDRHLRSITAVATVGWLVVTAWAAPLSFSQRTASDTQALTAIFDSFEQLNLLRAGLQLLALATLAGTLVLHLAASARR
ncbi:MAG: hypothetical protein H0U09_03905 [Geodermatophilaceae bacterium]|nr:hypothetical protein [Geodermatophilaceae bacterium]